LWTLLEEMEETHLHMCTVSLTYKHVWLHRRLTTTLDDCRRKKEQREREREEKRERELITTEKRYDK